MMYPNFEISSKAPSVVLKQILENVTVEDRLNILGDLGVIEETSSKHKYIIDPDTSEIFRKKTVLLQRKNTNYMAPTIIYKPPRIPESPIPGHTSNYKININTKKILPFDITKIMSRFKRYGRLFKGGII